MMMKTERQLRRILLVEDNPGDVVMTREALDRVGVTAELEVVSNGQEAIEFLRGQAVGLRESMPDLVLLDLNLPIRSGHQVLDDIGADVQLHGLPVAILTSSANEQDVCRRYSERYCEYFQKSPTFDGLTEVIQHILRFWRRVRKDA